MDATTILPPPAKPRNFCPSCGLDFNAMDGFDRHRTGKHAFLASPEYPDGRRCRSLDELRELGFIQDTNGRWYLPAPEGSRPDWAAIRARTA
jgi:hypothetical protein